MEEEFRKKIQEIVGITKYLLLPTDTTIDNNKLTLFESNDTTHTISINNNSVEFHTYSTYIYGNEIFTNDKAGKSYRDGNNLITKYCNSKIETYQSYQEIKTEEIISVFDENLVETSKIIRKDVKNYSINNGIKTLIQYEDSGHPHIYDNTRKTKKYTRTPNGNTIVIEETEYHDDAHKKYNNKIYCISCNYDDKRIHTYGHFTIVSEELYMDYVNGNITEEELFKHHTKLKRSSALMG